MRKRNTDREREREREREKKSENENDQETKLSFIHCCATQGPEKRENTSFFLLKAPVPAKSSTLSNGKSFQYFDE